MYAEANDCQGILILLIRLGRLRHATTKHRIHLFSLSSIPFGVMNLHESICKWERATWTKSASFDESDMRPASYIVLRKIFNLERTSGSRWVEEESFCFNDFFFFYANELVIVTIWKVGHEGNTNVFFSRIKIFERGCEHPIDLIIRIKY